MRIRVGVLAGAFLSLTLAAATSLAAQGAAATICKDGTTSATAGRGACSGHGGVDKTATDAAKKGAAKADKAASATAKSADKAADKAAKATDKAVDKTAKTTDKAAAKTATQASKTDAAVAKTASKAESKADKTVDKAAAKSAKTGADNNDPTNATAQCKDGTYSHAKNHQGACSNHGGVAKFLK